MASPKKEPSEAGGSSDPGGPPGGGQMINLAALELPQLQQLRGQIESELNFYQEAVVQLKDVQMKMGEAGNCLKKIKVQEEEEKEKEKGEEEEVEEEGTKNKKREMLVPVTGSMFVRGELEDVNKMLIDIGTGYYVEKSLEDATDYFDRKVKFLQGQIEKVQSVGREKSQIRSAILEVMEGKIAVLQAQGKLVPINPSK